MEMYVVIGVSKTYTEEIATFATEREANRFTALLMCNGHNFGLIKIRKSDRMCSLFLSTI